MYILNENIRRHRKERGMTQRKLAERLGTTDKTVSRWESGVQIPDAETVPALARIFGVSIGELYGEESTISADTAHRFEPVKIVPTFPAADRRVIHKTWITAIISVLLLLCGSFALCLNNFYSIPLHTVGYLYFYGNESGRLLGIILFCIGGAVLIAVLTAYKLWYRKPFRYNLCYMDTDAALNLAAVILFCVLLLFILPRFLGFAVTGVIRIGAVRGSFYLEYGADSTEARSCPPT